MAKSRTALVCGKPCEAPQGDYWAVCPFDSNHVVLRSRMPYHIVKCLKNHPNHNKIQCPYNSCEYIDPEEFPDHILSCESKTSISAEKYEKAELEARGIVIKQTPFFHNSAPQPDEDWGAPDPVEDDDKIENVGVERGMTHKKKIELPRKGMGRAESLNHILRQLNENKLGSNSISRSISSKDEDDPLKNVSSGQFDDDIA